MQTIATKLDVSALDLVPPLGGGTGLNALNAPHSTFGIGGLGGLQQPAQLSALLGGGTALTGGVSNGLAGLCALLAQSDPGRLAVTSSDLECDASPTSTTSDGGTGGSEAV